MKSLKYSIVLLCMVTLWGCGKSNASAPAAIDPSTGKHVPGWVDVGTGGFHPATYFADSASCEECHGKDLKGGISKVSCSPGPNNAGCHDVFPHSTGFNLPAAHGKSAIGVVTANGIFGMAHCQKCHGLDYTGGVGPSCIGCHKAQGSNPATNAPHGANWKVSGRHSKSDETNAAACFKCHAGGALSHPAPTPAPAGTAPGCFNGTLCHNNALPHSVPFTNATSHGKAIKVTNDWVYCGNCHADLSGGFQRYNVLKGSMTNGCESCHNKPFLAHPQMWLPGRGAGTPTTIGGVTLVKNTSHINVPAANILTSCTICHGIATPSTNPAVPSCATVAGQSIGGIQCHFTAPVNAAGQSLGCKSCHTFSSATDLVNVTSNKHAQHITPINANFPGLTPVCLACHVNSPVPGRDANHANGTTNVALLGQFGVAATFNATAKTCAAVICHGSANTTPAWTSAAVGCAACHTTPPSGASFPNTANAHAKHAFGCNVCHNNAGSGTAKHANGLANGNGLSAVVALLPAQAGATAAFSAVAKTCSNVTCHGGFTTPAWTATNTVGCALCHVVANPNSNGHVRHLSLIANLTCAACHTGDGPGIGTHPDAVHVVGFPTTPANFNNNGIAGSATYNLTNCSNVSCHGVFQTPFSAQAWTNPAPIIDVLDQSTCQYCHQVANAVAPAAGSIPTPYIGPFSGRQPANPALRGNNLHFFHVARSGFDCTVCHTLASHFNSLSLGRRALDRGFAAGTVGVGGPLGGGGVANDLSYDPGAGTCITNDLVNCHVGVPLTPDPVDAAKLKYRWYP